MGGVYCSLNRTRLYVYNRLSPDRPLPGEETRRRIIHGSNSTGDVDDQGDDGLSGSETDQSNLYGGLSEFGNIESDP